MALNTGDKLGPYEVIEPIGKGGMGEVYRANDPRLGRDVAVKVSGEHFSERFQREARLVAALNHPNICTLHDVGPDYLVMELVDGPTLAERIGEGPIPLDEAMAIAAQIAEALSAAHEAGIIHRDLKPGNVKIKPDGTVKVLDFGLAKEGGTPTAATSGMDASNSPTLSMSQTQAGMILGTAAYMAPEQARGKTVDKRADIWAYGVVLYEMLTGKRLFDGEDVSEILARVIEREPDFDAVPVRVRRLLESCLEKKPKNRLADIADAKLLIGIDDSSSVPTPAPATRSGWGTRLPWLAAAAALVIAATAVVIDLGEPLPAREPIRFDVDVPGQTNAVALYMALSPDGRELVFTSNDPDGINRLWIRSMDTLEARVVPGTEGAVSPFWSPDSRSIGFAVNAELKRVEASGGAPPVTLTDAGSLVGIGSWNADGVILFGSRGANQGISRVAASGGTSTPVTTPNAERQETFHSFPVFLPDGEHFIYFANSADIENQEGIYVGSLSADAADLPSGRLVSTEFGASWVPSTTGTGGRILFMREGTLMAQGFDPDARQLTGEPFPVAENVGFAGSGGYFSASPAGILAFRGGGGLERTLTWFDREGNIVGTEGTAGTYLDLTLSPDARRVIAHQEGGQADLWLVDFERDSTTRFTFEEGIERYGVWSPDGSEIVYTGDDFTKMFRRASNGAGEPELLLENVASARVQDWSPDGEFILFYDIGAETGIDLFVLPLEPAGSGERVPIPYLATPFIEILGRFSPDGRWVVYASNESGTMEVFVRPFAMPDGSGAPVGGKWMVSTGGGAQPIWNSNGSEILYLSPTGQLMSVEVDGSGTALVAGTPRPLFEIPIYPAANAPVVKAYWDISADGERFLVNTLDDAGATDLPITVVLDWEVELEQ